MDTVKILNSGFFNKKPHFKNFDSCQDVFLQKTEPQNKNTGTMFYEIRSPKLNSVLEHMYVEYEPQILLNITNVEIEAGNNLDDIEFLKNGVYMSLSYFPFHQSVDTLSYTICDKKVNHRIRTNLHRFLRFVRQDKARQTTPTANFWFANNTDSLGSYASPMLSHFERGKNHIGNGSFDFVYTNPNNGQELNGNGDYTYNGIVVDYVDGKVVGGGDVLSGDAYVQIKFKVFEKINPLKAFNFTDNINLFGFSKINLEIKQRTDMKDVFMFSNQVPNLPDNFNILRSASLIRVDTANVYSLFKFPSLEVSKNMPNLCIRNISEFQNYGQTFNTTINTGSNVFVNVPSTDSFSFPRTPSFFMIYAEPLAPIQTDDNRYNLAIDNINITYNNRSGILSTYTKEQLYQISRDNRSELSYNEFIGDLNTQLGKKLGVGSVILLKSGKDIVVKVPENKSFRNEFRMRIQIRNPVSNVYAENTLDLAGNPVTGNKNITSFRVHVVPIYDGLLSIDKSKSHACIVYTTDKINEKTEIKNIQYSKIQ